MWSQNIMNFLEDGLFSSFAIFFNPLVEKNVFQPCGPKNIMTFPYDGLFSKFAALLSSVIFLFHILITHCANCTYKFPLLHGLDTQHLQRKFLGCPSKHV